MKVLKTYLVLAGVIRVFKASDLRTQTFCFLHDQYSSSSWSCFSPNRFIRCETNETVSINKTIYFKQNQSAKTCQECFRGNIDIWPSLNVSNFKTKIINQCINKSCCFLDGEIDIPPKLDFVDGTVWYAAVTYQCINEGYNDTVLECDLGSKKFTSPSSNNTSIHKGSSRASGKTEQNNTIGPKLIASLVGGAVAFVIIVLFAVLLIRRHLKENMCQPSSHSRTEIMMENISYTSKDDALNTVNVVDIGSEKTELTNSTLPKDQTSSLTGQDNTGFIGMKEAEYAIINVESSVETKSPAKVSSDIDFASECQLTHQPEDTVHAYSTLSGDDDYSHIHFQEGIQMHPNMSEYSHLNHLQRTTQDSDYNTLHLDSQSHDDSINADTHNSKQSTDTLYDHTSH